MELFWQIAPLALLIVVSGLFVWRGMKTKPDSSHNNARGGGSRIR